MKVLMVKTSSMGDILHALPVAYDLRQAFPDLTLHWLSEEAFQDIAYLAPNVQKVHVCAFRRWRKAPFASKTKIQIQTLKAQLAAENYDMAIDIQGLMRSGLVTQWSKAKTKVGYSWSACKESLASLFYDQKLPFSAQIPAVERYRRAVSTALNYSVDLSTPRYGLKPTEPIEWALPPRFVALAVNTSRDDKCWPELSWARLGQRLHEKGYTCLFFWGNEHEKARCERIAQHIDGAVIMPRLKLGLIASILAKACAVVGVDTGLTHMAAALGVPSVGIFVSTSVALLNLVGDGPVQSLGGVGVVPSVDEVWQALGAVNVDLK